MEVKFRTLKAEEIDCRIAQIKEKWLSLLLYKDARVDQNILDETVGCMNWQKKYLRDNANCVVEIWDDKKEQWISKEDTGKESFSEAEKGLASDSFKRACFNWGIGRELYTAPSIFIYPKEKEFFQTTAGKWTTKTKFYVELIGYDDNRNIKDLIIRDNKNFIRFSKLSKETEQKTLKLQMQLKKAIEAVEKIDEKYDRENLYKNFGVNSDSQMTYKQMEQAIEMLKNIYEKEKK